LHHVTGSQRPLNQGSSKKFRESVAVPGRVTFVDPDDGRCGMKSTIERAFELAAGECKTVQDIERQLRREGHLNVTEHFSGPTLRRQLIPTIRASKSNKPCA
jgi:hypothetical protein